MSRNPDNEYQNVNKSDYGSGSVLHIYQHSRFIMEQLFRFYLQFSYPTTIINDNRNPVNDDLHEQLDFKYPKKKNEKE